MGSCKLALGAYLQEGYFQLSRWFAARHRRPLRTFDRFWRRSAAPPRANIVHVEGSGVGGSSVKARNPGPLKPVAKTEPTPPEVNSSIVPLV